MLTDTQLRGARPSAVARSCRMPGAVPAGGAERRPVLAVRLPFPGQAEDAGLGVYPDVSLARPGSTSRPARYSRPASIRPRNGPSGKISRPWRACGTTTGNRAAAPGAMAPIRARSASKTDIFPDRPPADCRLSTVGLPGHGEEDRVPWRVRGRQRASRIEPDHALAVAHDLARTTRSPTSSPPTS